jgi:hypothetical protein
MKFITLDLLLFQNFFPSTGPTQTAKPIFTIYMKNMRSAKNKSPFEIAFMHNLFSELKMC